MPVRMYTFPFVQVVLVVNGPVTMWVLALLVAAGGRLFALRFEAQRIAVEVTSWYWHYLAFLWFGIFALVHFARS